MLIAGMVTFVGWWTRMADICVKVTNVVVGAFIVQEWPLPLCLSSVEGFCSPVDRGWVQPCKGDA